MTVREAVLDWAKRQRKPWTANDAAKALGRLHHVSVHARVCELAKEGFLTRLGQADGASRHERAYVLAKEPKPRVLSAGKKKRSPAEILAAYRTAVRTRNDPLERELRIRILKAMHQEE